MSAVLSMRSEMSPYPTTIRMTSWSDIRRVGRRRQARTLVAPTEATVLLQGGRDRQGSHGAVVHTWSHENDRPFVRD